MSMCVNGTIEIPSVSNICLDCKRDIDNLLHQNFEGKPPLDERLTFQSEKWCINRNQCIIQKLMFSLGKSTNDSVSWKSFLEYF